MMHENQAAVKRLAARWGADAGLGWLPGWTTRDAGTLQEKPGEKDPLCATFRKWAAKFLPQGRRPKLERFRRVLITIDGCQWPAARLPLPLPLPRASCLECRHARTLLVGRQPLQCQETPWLKRGMGRGRARASVGKIKRKKKGAGEGENGVSKIQGTGK